MQLGHVLRRGSVRAAQRGRLLDEGVHCLLVLLERGHVHILERNVHAPIGCRVHLREAALSEHLAELVALGDVADLAIDDLGLVQPRAQRDHGTEPCLRCCRARIKFLDPQSIPHEPLGKYMCRRARLKNASE